MAEAEGRDLAGLMDRWEDKIKALAWTPKFRAGVQWALADLRRALAKGTEAMTESKTLPAAGASPLREPWLENPILDRLEREAHTLWAHGRESSAAVIRGCVAALRITAASSSGCVATSWRRRRKRGGRSASG